MSYRVLSWFLPGLLALLILVSPGRANDGLTWENPPFRAFSDELGRVIKKYYPEVKLEKGKKPDQPLQWSYNTRKFMLHIPTLTGKWQEAVEMLGPDRKGVLCTAEIHEGPYMGMAVVPQTFDRHYFKLLMLGPSRKDVNAHLIVRLSYPDDADKAFVAELAELVQKFDSER